MVKWCLHFCKHLFRHSAYRHKHTNTSFLFEEVHINYNIDYKVSVIIYHIMTYITVSYFVTLSYLPCFIHFSLQYEWESLGLSYLWSNSLWQVGLQWLWHIFIHFQYLFYYTLLVLFFLNSMIRVFIIRFVPPGQTFLFCY